MNNREDDKRGITMNDDSQPKKMHPEKARQNFYLLGRVSYMACPGDACAEDDRGAVDDGEFVVAGGQPAPLFEQCE